MDHLATNKNRSHSKSSHVKGTNLSTSLDAHTHQKRSKIKSIDQYRSLAQEAMLAGDQILAESYYQQIEHCIRLNNKQPDHLYLV